jgi:hypothetical protein
VRRDDEKQTAESERNTCRRGPAGGELEPWNLCRGEPDAGGKDKYVGQLGEAQTCVFAHPRILCHVLRAVNEGVRGSPVADSDDGRQVVGEANLGGVQRGMVQPMSPCRVVIRGSGLSRWGEVVENHHPANGEPPLGGVEG